VRRHIHFLMSVGAAGWKPTVDQVGSSYCLGAENDPSSRSKAALEHMSFPFPVFLLLIGTTWSTSFSLDLS